MATHGGVDPQSQSSTTNPITNNPHQAHPCPSCGHCPTCGRNGRRYPSPYRTYPYPYQPYVWHGVIPPNHYQQYTFTNNTVAAV